MREQSAPRLPEWTTFDSRSTPVAQRTARWARMTEEFLVPLRLEPVQNPISGVIAGRRSSKVGFCRLAASAHRGVRTKEAAGGIGAGHYKIAIAREGRVSVSQYDRRVTLRPGEMTVYDTSDECSVGSIAPFGVPIALIPRNALGVKEHRLAAVSASAFAGPSSIAARNLLLAAARGDGSLGRALEAIDELIKSAQPASTGRARSDAELLERAIALIENGLADNRLGPDHLAAALGVSRRRIYQVFDREVGPIALYIRTKRMELARTLLASPDWVDASIGQIALECGVADQAHFSRLFARAHGQSPRAFRALEAVDRAVDGQDPIAPRIDSGR